MRTMQLTERQARFVDHYMELGNAVQAAIRAGYAESTAKKSAYELLRKPQVMREIDSRMQEIKTSRTATIAEVQAYWAEVMRDENNRVMDRLKASEYIAKTGGAFVDRVKHELPRDVVINVLPKSEEQ